MVDKKWIGHEIGSSVLPVERGRLKFFAKAIGETNPVYLDESAAREAGYADLPAPPTFLFTAELDSGAMFGLLERLGVPIRKVLHGEQSFEYLGPIVAGDTVTVTSRVKDIYEKKGGALEFIETETESQVANQRGEPVGRLRSLTVVRN
ncbi:MaoC family dehydratase N-terminal domain-containing protein [Cupriavidus basilensis]